MEYLDVPSLISNIFLMLVPIVGAIILGMRTRGRPLTFGLIGCLLSAVAALGFVIFQLATANGSSWGFVITLIPPVLTFVQCAGLLLLILAIVARPAAAAPGPPPGYPPSGYQPGPGNYQGPWSQA